MPRSQAGINARAFLAAYRQAGNVTEAAAAANIDRRAHYYWLRVPEYAAAFERAKTAYVRLRGESVEAIEANAIIRARDGYLEPVFYQGIKCGAVRRWPEAVVLGLLRAHKPEIYGQRPLEISGVDGGAIEIVERLNAGRTRMNRINADNGGSAE